MMAEAQRIYKLLQVVKIFTPRVSACFLHASWEAKTESLLAVVVYILLVWFCNAVPLISKTSIFKKKLQIRCVVTDHHLCFCCIDTAISLLPIQI